MKGSRKSKESQTPVFSPGRSKNNGRDDEDEGRVKHRGTQVPLNSPGIRRKTVDESTSTEKMDCGSTCDINKNVDQNSKDESRLRLNKSDEQNASLRTRRPTRNERSAERHEKPADSWKDPQGSENNNNNEGHGTKDRRSVEGSDGSKAPKGSKEAAKPPPAIDLRNLPIVRLTTPDDPLEDIRSSYVSCNYWWKIRSVECSRCFVQPLCKDNFSPCLGNENYNQRKSFESDKSRSTDKGYVLGICSCCAATFKRLHRISDRDRINKCVKDQKRRLIEKKPQQCRQKCICNQNPKRKSGTSSYNTTTTNTSSWDSKTTSSRPPLRDSFDSNATKDEFAD